LSMRNISAPRSIRISRPYDNLTCTVP